MSFSAKHCRLLQLLTTFQRNMSTLNEVKFSHNAAHLNLISCQILLHYHNYWFVPSVLACWFHVLRCYDVFSICVPPLFLFTAVITQKAHTVSRHGFTTITVSSAVASVCITAVTPMHACRCVKETVSLLYLVPVAFRFTSTWVICKMFSSAIVYITLTLNQITHLR